MFKSREEINKVYSDHLDSLAMWGGEFDAESVGRDWQEALDQWDAEKEGK